MTDRPIIFSGPMVRALLAGRKTQTRRAIKPRPWNRDGDTVDISKASAARYVQGSDGRHYIAFDHRLGGPLTAYLAPFVIGDRLWVRETYSPGYDHDPDALDGVPKCEVIYRSDNAVVSCPASYETAEMWARMYAEDGPDDPIVKPPIHMPRWASRLTLAVTDVRVERLNEISEADAVAEGFGGDFPHKVFPDLFPDSAKAGEMSMRECFAVLWNSIYGPDAWGASPWVVAASFTVATENIDAAARMERPSAKAC